MLRWISIRSPVGFRHGQLLFFLSVLTIQLYCLWVAVVGLSMRTSSLVNHQLGVYHHLPVVSPFSPREEQHNKQRDNGDDASGCCPDPGIFDCFCKSVELGESRFPGHLGSSAGLLKVASRGGRASVESATAVIQLNSLDMDTV